MSAERDVSVSVPCMGAEDIADLVSVNRFQPESEDLAPQPLAPCAFAKGRRGNARQLQLPLRELRLLGAKPGTGRANFGQRTEVGNFLLHARKQLRYFRLRARHGRVFSRWSLAYVVRL